MYRFTKQSGSAELSQFIFSMKKYYDIPFVKQFKPLICEFFEIIVLLFKNQSLGNDRN
jgi:hypothetical protein